MTDVPPPPSAAQPPPLPGTSPPPPPPGAPIPPPGTPPPKNGVSTGKKIAIGCGVVLLLVLILLFACFSFLGKKVGDLEETLEDQEKAGETVQELEREYPFTPPPDGTLDEDQVDAFFAVTDDVWDEIESWVRDMEERGTRVEESESEAGFGDAMAGMRGMGSARVAFVEALDEHDMAPSAYVWTGFTLLQAHDALASGAASPGVPEKNLELARKHARRLAELEEEEGDEADKGSVLALAFVFFPRMDVLLPAGFDTTPDEQP
jgi:molybdopterin converting factor small subunit